MRLFSYIPSFLRNKYFIAASAFVTWMLFFDEKDVFTQRDRRGELDEMKQSKEYFIREIAREQKALEELKSDPAAIEKYARENYLMKRDNEDLFLIHTPENK